jgi:hypothetical protein
MNTPDILVENHGSVVLLRPRTPLAAAWIEEHVQSEDWQWIYGALAVEPRFVQAVIQGAREDGLEVR